MKVKVTKYKVFFFALELTGFWDGVWPTSELKIELLQVRDGGLNGQHSWSVSWKYRDKSQENGWEREHDYLSKKRSIVAHFVK